MNRGEAETSTPPDEYTPQISALMDLRDDITSAFANYPDESVLSNIRMMISNKIQELKERSIMERVRQEKESMEKMPE